MVVTGHSLAGGNPKEGTNVWVTNLLLPGGSDLCLLAQFVLDLSRQFCIAKWVLGDRKPFLKCQLCIRRPGQAPISAL